MAARFSGRVVEPAGLLEQELARTHPGQEDAAAARAEVHGDVKGFRHLSPLEPDGVPYLRKPPRRLPLSYEDRPAGVGFPGDNRGDLAARESPIPRTGRSRTIAGRVKSLAPAYASGMRGSPACTVLG